MLYLGCEEDYVCFLEVWKMLIKLFEWLEVFILEEDVDVVVEKICEFVRIDRVLYDKV